jgi:hypothetical protein
MSSNTDSPMVADTARQLVDAVFETYKVLGFSAKDAKKVMDNAFMKAYPTYAEGNAPKHAGSQTLAEDPKTKSVREVEVMESSTQTETKVEHKSTQMDIDEKTTSANAETKTRQTKKSKEAESKKKSTRKDEGDAEAKEPANKPKPAKSQDTAAPAKTITRAQTNAARKDAADAEPAK